MKKFVIFIEVLSIASLLLSIVFTFIDSYINEAIYFLCNATFLKTIAIQQEQNNK